MCIHLPRVRARRLRIDVGALTSLSIPMRAQTNPGAASSDLARTAACWLRPFQKIIDEAGIDTAIPYEQRKIYGVDPVVPMLRICGGYSICSSASRCAADCAALAARMASAKHCNGHGESHTRWHVSRPICPSNGTCMSAFFAIWIISIVIPFSFVRVRPWRVQASAASATYS